MLKRLLVCIVFLLVVAIPVVFTAPAVDPPSKPDSISDAQTKSDVLDGILRKADDQEWLYEDQAEVVTIQTLLEELGYTCGGIDGILGPNTERAISSFRKDKTLPANRIVRPITTLLKPEIRINIPEYTLSVIDREKIIKQFNIAVGTPYEQTPTGRYFIFDKIEYPTWYPGANFSDQEPVPPGPDNPLGTRWMEFAPNYGIHGTNKDWDICYPVSGGCVRMHDVEARELYGMVEMGTPVVVVYETMKMIEKEDGLYLKLLPDIYRKQTSTQEQFLQLYDPYASVGYKLVQQNTSLPKEVDEVMEIKIAVKPQLLPLPRGPANYQRPKASKSSL